MDRRRHRARGVMSIGSTRALVALTRVGMKNSAARLPRAPLGCGGRVCGICRGLLRSCAKRLTGFGEVLTITFGERAQPPVIGSGAPALQPSPPALESRLPHPVAVQVRTPVPINPNPRGRSPIIPGPTNPGRSARLSAKLQAAVPRDWDSDSDRFSTRSLARSFPRRLSRANHCLQGKKRRNASSTALISTSFSRLAASSRTAKASRASPARAACSTNNT